MTPAHTIACHPRDLDYDEDADAWVSTDARLGWTEGFWPTRIAIGPAEYLLDRILPNPDGTANGAHYELDAPGASALPPDVLIFTETRA